MIETEYTIEQITHLYRLHNKGEEEIWKQISEDVPYALSSYGRIINMNSGRFISPFKDISKNDFLCFNIHRPGINSKKYLHLSIGKLFFGLNTKQRYQTRFLDGDNRNYFYKNLEFESIKTGKIINYNNAIRNKKDDDELNDYLDYLISLHREDKEELLYI